jgi:hypothetical protein
MEKLNHLMVAGYKDKYASIFWIHLELVHNHPLQGIYTLAHADWFLAIVIFQIIR